MYKGKDIPIGGRMIGEAHPTFIIAEAGVNHNGSLDTAIELVKVAKRCNADCVKFQTFKADRGAVFNAPKADYQVKVTDPNESQIAMLKKLELPKDAYQEIMKVCREEDILFMSTPYNPEDADFLASLNVSAFKLASITAAEPKFAKYVAQKGKPVILSTGMATLGEVEETVAAMRETGNEDLILLQCTTNYPSQEEDCNLLAMQTMREALNIAVGYSDHTSNEIASIISVALGAKVIEKHLTLNKNLPGPDQSTSFEPEEFLNLVKSIRNAEKVLGSSRKEPCEIEKINAVGMRRSIVSNNNIDVGTTIVESMLAFKRPATGLSPKFYDYVVGKKTKKEILADSQIKFSDLE